MLWVVVFLLIALAGLAMLVGYAIWLAHKTAELLNELGVLGEQAAQLAEIVGEIRAPATTTLGERVTRGGAGPLDVG